MRLVSVLTVVVNCVLSPAVLVRICRGALPLHATNKADFPVLLLHCGSPPIGAGALHMLQYSQNKTAQGSTLGVGTAGEQYILQWLFTGVLQALCTRSLCVWHPPDVRADFFGRESREEHFCCLAKANRLLHFADLAGKNGHSGVHQMPSSAQARKHRERVVVVPGFLQDNAIQLKKVGAARCSLGYVAE